MPPRRLLRIAALALFLFVLPEGAGARPARTLRVRFPRVTVPAQGTLEACWVVHVPLDEPFDMVEWHVRHRGTGGSVGVRHFLVSQYLGDRPGRAPARGERPVPRRGCLELPWQPPGAEDARVLVAGVRGSNGVLPGGLALPLAPTPTSPGGPPAAVVLVLSGNWANGSSRDRDVSATVELRRASPGSVRRRLSLRRDAAAAAGISVEPFATATASAVWQPPGDVCVYEVSGAFHRRGRFLGVDRLDASGAAANPDPTVTNPLEVGRRHLFGMTDYTDGGSRVFPAGLLLRAGEALAWTCWLENGVLFPVRLGCEETPGVVPGSRAGGPATPCPATAPISPECGAGDGGVRPRTGACVPAAVVAGVAPGDETCALQVAYWEVSAGAGCDLGGPPANP